MPEISKKCTRKSRHDTFPSAVEHWKRIFSDPQGYDKERLVIYACGCCGGWHVGHETKDQAARRRGLVG